MDDFHRWPVVATQEWQRQQDQFGPEEYGTVVHYRDPSSGMTIAEQTSIRPCDWLDPSYGEPVTFPAGTFVTSWVCN